MTRTESALYRARHLLWIATGIIVLAGGLAFAFYLIGRESHRADLLADEASLRGNAVSTLAGDVRALRQQVKAEGKTPVAPDPSRAVDDLSARSKVPVPIPGPPGLTGSPGPSGAAGRNGVNGKPGASGVSGASGAPGGNGTPGGAGPTGPAGPQGAAGPAGPAGKDGADGRDGQDGQTCPAGYSLQAPSYDPDALVCRENGAPEPSPSPSPTDSTPAPLALALDPQRPRYRR